MSDPFIDERFGCVAKQGYTMLYGRCQMNGPSALQRRLFAGTILLALLFGWTQEVCWAEVCCPDAGCAIEPKSNTASEAYTINDHFIPADKELDPQWVELLFDKGQRKEYSGKELETIGMPCGGVCAGQLYVRGDGTLAKWWIANNAHATAPYWVPMEDLNIEYKVSTPLGDNRIAYRTYRPESYIDQGFAVRVKPAGGKPQVRTLDRDGFKAIRFIGEYPIATIGYRDRQASDWPVEVTGEVFSPFIPLNTRDSANPATILRYTVKNTSDTAVDVTIAGWQQNAVCLDLMGKYEVLSRNRVMRHPGMTSVYMDVSPRSAPQEEISTVFEDFEDGTYDDWTVEGEAFGKGPATGTLTNQQVLAGWKGRYFINSYLGGNDELQGRMLSGTFKIKEPYITFLIGGGNHSGRTSLNLVVDGKVVYAATGTRNTQLQQQFWCVESLIGKEAHLEIVDSESAGWGHVTVDNICFANVPPIGRRTVPSGHRHFGNMTLTSLDAAATATAGWNSKEAFIADLREDGQLTGPPVAKSNLGDKCSGALASSFSLAPGESKTATFLLTWYFPNRMQGDKKVGNMYREWFNSSLDVATYIAENFKRLDSSTQLFRDTWYDTTLPYWFVQRISMPISCLATETCQWWANGRFYAWEGVGCCPGTCNHVWHYDQALGRLFPELQRSAIEMQYLNPQTRFNDKTGYINMRGEYWGNVWAADGHAGCVLMAFRQHQFSPDNTFLKSNWPGIRKAIEFMIQQDGNNDGVLEGHQNNTYDIPFFGANSMIGSLYHAVLLAGEKMALAMDDGAFAEKCRRIYESGRKWTEDQLFDGEYFMQIVDHQKYPQHQYGKGCLSDQLLGQTWAHLVGLGHLYREDQVRSALQSVFKYNWAPDVGPQYKAHRPEIYFAMPGEAGLFLCTWPKTRHMGNGHASVRYRNTIWTGIEFQVASGMIYEGLLKEGLAIVRGIHERYDGVKHNPWNHVLCGDFYSRAMASWGCLLAASGYVYDGPAGMIGFAPRLTPENFKAFFSAAEGWGSLVQTRIGSRQSNRIEVKWGRLRVKSLQLELPSQAKLAAASVTVAGRQVNADAKQQGTRVTIVLPQAEILEKNQEIEARIVFHAL